MAKKHKIITKIFLLFFFTILTLYLLFKNDYKSILLVLKKTSPLYVILAICCMLFVFVMDGIILTLIANSFQKGYRLHQGILNQQCNVFFNGITPLATGGQPFQVYLFKKQGIDIANGIGIVFIYFIFYKFSLLSFALFSFLYNYRKLNAMVNQTSYNLLFILIISFILIASLSVLLILVAYLKIFQKFFHQCIRLLARLKIIKNEPHAHQIFDEKIASTRQNIKHILCNWKLILILICLMFLRFFIYYMIPYICFYAIACPIQKTYFLDSISLSSFISLISGIFPSPGGTVGVELAYTYLFKNYFVDKFITNDIVTTVKSSLIVWRFITFYFGLILGALVVLLYQPRKKYKIAKNIKIDQQI